MNVFCPFAPLLPRLTIGAGDARLPSTLMRKWASAWRSSITCELGVESDNAHCSNTSVDLLVTDRFFPKRLC